MSIMQKVRPLDILVIKKKEKGVALWELLLYVNIR